MAQETLARTAWDRALQRAVDDCLDVLVEPVSGKAFVESASHPGVLYEVSSLSCTCAAGANGQPCKHRAAYLAQYPNRWPPLVIPTAAEAPVIDCPDCCGCGVVHYRTQEQPCDVCGATGVIEVAA